MSTPADFKRMEEKKKKQAKMACTVAALPQYTSLATSSSSPAGSSRPGSYPPRNNVSWLYQPSHPHRELDRNGSDFTRDSYGGRTYTDFSRPPDRQPFRPQTKYNNHNKQWKNNTTRGGPPKKELPLPEVKEAPISMSTMDFVIEPANVACFHGKFHFLSNMFPCKLVVDSNVYSSVEHYYQCTKVFTFMGPLGASQMKGITDAGQQKAEARRILKNVPKDRIEAWKMTEAPKIINHAIHLKFTQNPELGRQLAATGSAILAHSFDRDNFYATAMDVNGVKQWAKENSGQIYRLPIECHLAENRDFIPLVGKGRNLLGALLMLNRRSLSKEPDAPPAGQQPALPVSMLEADRAADLMNSLKF